MPNQEKDDRIVPAAPAAPAGQVTKQASTNAQGQIDTAHLDYDLLDAGGVLEFKDEQGRVQAMTKLVTPEFYNKYMDGSRRIDRMSVAAPKPPPEVLQAMYDGINQHWSSLQEYDPETVNRLLRYPHLIATDAELAAQIGETIGPYDSAEYAVKALYGDIPTLDYESYDDTWMKTPVTKIFLDKYSRMFNPTELDVISTTLGTVDVRGREQLMGLAMVEAGAHDMETQQGREDFMLWLYNRGLRMNQTSLARQYEFPVFKWLEAPQNWVEEQVRTKILPYFTGGGIDPVANPDEWAAISALSIGEQIAVKMGANPSDTAFGWISAPVDFLQEIGLDPANALFAMGAGAKIATSIPKVGAAAEMGQMALSLRSAIPFLGRKIGETTLPRGPFVRAWWSVFAKDVEKAFATPEAQVAFGKIYQAAQDGGWARVVQYFPSLEKNGATLGPRIVEATDPEEVGWILREGYKGAWTSNGSDAFLLLQRESRQADIAYRAASENLMDNGRLGFQSLSGHEDVDAFNGMWDMVDDVTPYQRPDYQAILDEGVPSRHNFDSEADYQHARTRYDAAQQWSMSGGATDRYGNQWEELDDSLTYYHATSAGRNIRQEGFRTRYELGQDFGSGKSLGGGSRNTVSITDNEERAYSIVNAYRQLGDLFRGDVTASSLVDDLIEQTGRADLYDVEDPLEALDQVSEVMRYWDEDKLKALDEGVIVKEFTDGAYLDEVANQGAGGTTVDWIPDESTRILDENGEPMWTRFSRKMTPQEKDSKLQSFYSDYLAARAEHLDEIDPGFYSIDPDVMRAIDPDDIEVFAVKVRPGTYGTFHPSEDEFRIADSSRIYAVDEYTGQEMPWIGNRGAAVRLRQATPTGDGTGRMVFRMNTRIGDLNADSAEAVFNFLETLPDDIPKRNLFAWLQGSTESLGDEAYEEISRWMRSQGLDALRREDGEAILRSDALGTIRPIMDDASLPAAADSLRGLMVEKVKSNASLSSALRGERSWFVSDLPKKAQRLERAGLIPGKWWRKFASNNSDGWWGNFRRRASAYTFGKVAPSKVHIGDGVQGAQELRTILSRIGVKQESIEFWYNTFLTTPFEERMAVVYDAVMDAGHELDIAPLKFMLAQWANKNGIFSFGFDAAGNEIGIAGSRSRPGSLASRPWLKTHYSEHVDVPIDAVLQTVKRWRQTQNKFEGLFTRGLLAGTRNNRARIAQEFGAQLKARGQYLEGAFSEEDLIAMAYSVVERDGGEGIGHLSRLTNTMLVKPWNKIHGVFSVLQLAARPLQWMERVVLLEEQVRGTLTGLPSMYRNPFRWATRTWESHVLRAQGKHTERMVEWIAGQTDALMNPLMEGGQTAATASLRDQLPGFASYLDNLRNQPTSMRGLRSTLSRYLTENLGLTTKHEELSRSGLRLAANLRRSARRVESAEALRKTLGLPGGTDWSEIVEEISHKGIWNIFTEEAASSVVPVTLTGKLTAREKSVAGQAWGKIVHQAVHDPGTSLAMRALADKLAPSGGASVNYAGTIIRNGWWRTVKNGVRDILTERGLNTMGMGDLELAQHYLDDLLIPHIENIFAPLNEMDIAERATILKDLARDKAAHIELRGFKYNLDLTSSNVGASIPNMRRMVVELQPLGVPFPPKLASYFDPRFMSQDNGAAILPGFRKMSNWIIENFGERATQVLNRQPAFLSVYKPWYEFYSKGLGFSREVAYELARDKAVEKVNFVYYNLANSTPLLRKLGKVIPFFGAMWEVAQTWAYKIPTMEAGVLGYPEMIRKVDRVYDLFINLGLLSHEETENEDGSKSVRLTWTSTRDEAALAAMNPIGAAISKTGFNLANSIPTLLNHLTHLRGYSDEALETGTKDTYKFVVGNPFVPQSQGIMGVNQFYFSMNPVGSFATSSLLRTIPALTDARVVGAKAGMTLDEVAAQAGVDVNTLIQENAVRIGDMIGQEALFHLFNGSLPTNEVVLGADVVLNIPNSSFMDTLLKDLMFQFGEVESPAGIIREFVPQWSQYFLRGLGVWHGGEEGKFWQTDDEGKFILGDGFLQILSSPGMDATGVAGQWATEAMNLEASEGLITRWTQEVDILNAMVDAELTDQADYESQKLKVEQLSAEIVKRSTDNTGAALMVRGLMGLVSPSTPRTLYKEQNDVQMYWTAQDIKNSFWEQRGLTDWIGKLPTGGVQNVEAFNELLQRFLTDESNDDDARAFLRKSYPAIWAHAFGKSYWGEQGEPPESRGFDQYLQQVEDGQRLPYAPDIFLQRIARSAVATDREIALVESFGNDPSKAAVTILNNWEAYQDIREEANTKLNALDYYDDFYGGKAYAAWKDRNRSDISLLAEEQSRRMDEILEAAEMFEDLAISADMDPRDRDAFLGQIKGITQGTKDAINAYREANFDPNDGSPRERILNWYFDSVMVPYYEQVNALYDQISKSTDSEEQSRLYDKVRDFRNDTFAKRVFNPNTGDEFPNIIDWAWNKKSEEEQQAKLQKWANQPLEWLDMEAVARLVAQEPVLSDFLPKTLQDWAVYTNNNALKSLLGDWSEGTVETGGVPIVPANLVGKVGDKIEQAMRLQLLAEGRGGEIAWQEMYPIERLEVANLLPQSLLPYAQQARYIRQLLSTAGPQGEALGPKTATGQRLFDYVFAQMIQDMAVNPILAADMRALGLTVYDEGQYDQIFPKLMYGDLFGEA